MGLRISSLKSGHERLCTQVDKPIAGLLQISNAEDFSTTPLSSGPPSSAAHRAHRMATVGTTTPSASPPGWPAVE